MEKLNYNFIRVIISIVEHGNMSRAAEELEMLPGSISYAVGQLRKHFNDPLFVRSKNGVQPTVLARQLYVHFKEAEGSIEQAFSLRPHDEMYCDLTVHVLQPIELYMMKRLIDREFFSGKNTLTFPAYSTSNRTRLHNIRSLQVDLDIGLALEADPSIVRVKLKDADYVYVARKENPIDIDSLVLTGLNLKNALTNVNASWTHVWPIIEEMHKINFKAGLEQDNRIYYYTNSVLNIIMLICMSNVTYFMPKFLFDFFADYLPLKSAPCPVFSEPRFSMYAHYHINNKNKQAIAEILDVFHTED